MVVDINKSLLLRGSNVIIKLDEQFDVDDIIQYKEEIDGLSNTSRLSRYFSISYDSVEWSKWEMITDISLSTMIDFTQKFYIKLKYEVSMKYDSIPIKIKSCELITKNKNVPVDKFVPNLLEGNYTDEYGAMVQAISEAGTKIESTVNYFVNLTSPIEVIYVLTSPDKKSTDVFLNEYSIYNEDARKCIKIVIDENSVPERNPQFDEFGIDFEKFVAYIDINYFQEMFGKDKYPRENDYMFFNKAKQMYYVFSALLKTGVDEQKTHFELALKKYDENLAIGKSDETQEFVDSALLTREKLFGDKLEEGMIDMSNPDQNLTKMISEDHVRESVHENMAIDEVVIVNHSNDLLKSYYNLTAIPSDEIAIKYISKYNIPVDGGFSYMSWFKLFSSIPQEFDIINQTRLNSNELKLTLSLNVSILNLLEDLWIDNGTDFLYVSEIINEKEIKVISKVFISKLENWKLTNTTNLLMSLDLDASFKIDISQTKALIRHNFDIYISDTNINLDVWYSIFINISNIHKYVGVYLWKIDDDINNKLGTALINVNKNETVINKNIIINETAPYITGSNSNMGNIRLFNRTVDFEYQSMIAGNRNIKKPSTTFIIDDAQIIFNLPRITKGNLSTDIKFKKP